MKILFVTLLCVLHYASAYSQAPGDSVKKMAGKKIDNPSGQKGLTVFPARLVFNLDKGQSSSQVLNIGNFTDTRYQITIDFKDWIRDTLGKHVYTPKGTSQQSCASWLHFDKSIIDLSPGEATTLTVTMSIPNDEQAVSGMKWTMLVVKTVAEKHAPVQGARLATQIEHVYGLGIHVLQTPPNISNKELKMLSFSALAGKNRLYRVVCRNIGGVELTAKFSVELSEVETGKKTVLQPDPVPLFPQQTRYVDFELPAGLAKGKYTAIALIDAEDDAVPIEAAEKEIEIR
jgi:hypothetical protein